MIHLACVTRLRTEQEKKRKFKSSQRKYMFDFTKLYYCLIFCKMFISATLKKKTGNKLNVIQPSIAFIHATHTVKKQQISPNGKTV